MKNNLYKYNLTEALKLNVFLLLLFGGCRNTDVIKEVQEESALKTEKKQVEASEEKNNGTYYSDSMINVLSKLDESIEIDSFADLHSFDKAKSGDGKTYWSELPRLELETVQRKKEDSGIVIKGEKEASEDKKKKK